jgi:adenosylmethionine-8-amino-7-oxononanoate aminotransferase
MHHLFSSVLTQQLFAPKPTCRFEQTCTDSHFTDFQQLLTTHADEIAAVIVEPIVQGAGGMWFYSPQYLQRIRELCTEYGILLIADEIATGFGRTGKLFACEHAAISPDILCLGKALTGGYMTLAATLCTQKIAHTICQGDAGALMHGPTFMANPLACSVANASIDLLLSDDWQAHVSVIEQQLLSGLHSLVGRAGIHDVRVLGAIGVIELTQAVDMQRIQPLFVEHGVWVRPFGKLVYLMPPFSMTESELAFLITQTKAVIHYYLAA